MVVSRVFTIYQLANLVINELSRIIEQFSSGGKNTVIVINGLLHLFASDPHIDKTDAKQLLKEISSSIKKLSEYMFVVVSFDMSYEKYEKYLLPILDNVIEVTHDTTDNGLLQAKIGCEEGSQQSTVSKKLRATTCAFIIGLWELSWDI
jgi:hypothetical protein